MTTLAVLDTAEELAQLRDEWAVLVQGSGSNSVFNTWHWASAWWNSYGSDKRLCVVTVRDDKGLAAIVPLYREQFVRFGLRYDAMRLIGDGSFDSDYLDAIVRRGAEPVLDAALRHILLDAADRPDVLFVNEVLEDSAIVSCARRLLQPLGWHWREEEVPCTIATLPADWESYLKRLAPRMRTKLRSLERELHKKHDVRYECCESPSDLPKRLASLFELHERRWLLKGQGGVFTSGQKRGFYEAMSAAFLAEGALRLHSLMADGRYVAHQFCLERNGTMFLLQEGFDPDWQERGVGNVLRSHVFRDCIARGIASYDFLAGVTSHKLSWGATIRKELRIAAGQRGYRNALFFGVPKAREAAKRVAKKILPDRVIAWHRSRVA